uniref:Bola-like protein n=1 Tax=Dunaliella tertiolecta TaxID=3047 RepID=A0A7S3VUN7_DUNTE
MRRFFSKMAQPTNGPIASSLLEKVQSQLNPAYINLVNESHKHAGHAGNTRGTAAFEARETHFKLELVSEKFAGLPAVRRHQLVYGLLDEEFKQGLHALSMKLKTPEEAN